MMLRFSARSAGVALILFLLLCAPGAARASHYPLADLGLFSESELTALAAQQIQTSAELLARVAGPRERAALVKALKAKVKAARVKEWSDFCDLLQVPGIGPTMVKLLRATGVPNTAELMRRKPAELAAQLGAVNEKAHIAGKTPSEEHLVNWIAAARTVPVKVH